MEQFLAPSEKTLPADDGLLSNLSSEDSGKSLLHETHSCVSLADEYKKQDRCTWIWFRIFGGRDNLESFKLDISKNQEVGYANGHLCRDRKDGIYVQGVMHFQKRMSPTKIECFFTEYSKHHWGSLKSSDDIESIQNQDFKNSECVEKDFIIVGADPGYNGIKAKSKSDKRNFWFKKYKDLSAPALTKKLFEEGATSTDIEEVKKRRVLMLKINQKDKMLEEAQKIKWKPWQQELIKELMKPAHPREIITVLDKVGNTGKTFFMKNWKILNEETVCNISNGNTRDLMHVIAKKPLVETIFLNLPRSVHDSINYQAIEQAKDGEFTTTKYNGEEVTIPSPKMVIFTNKALNWSACSEDRWKIMVIDGEEFSWYQLASFMIMNRKCLEAK